MGDGQEISFRCPSRVAGIIKFDPRTRRAMIEIKCHAGHCKRRPGEAVFHYFDLGEFTGTLDLIETKRFKDPAQHFVQKGKRG